MIQAHTNKYYSGELITKNQIINGICNLQLFQFHDRSLRNAFYFYAFFQAHQLYQLPLFYVRA